MNPAPYICMLVCMVPAIAQTKPRPSQIRNVQQVRIYYGDGAPATTHVNARQLADGRFIMDPASLATFPPFTDPTDPTNVISPVCVMTWTAVQIPQALDPPSVVLVSFAGQQTNVVPACFTRNAVAAIRSDPSWGPWLSAHGQ